MGFPDREVKSKNRRGSPFGKYLSCEVGYSLSSSFASVHLAGSILQLLFTTSAWRIRRAVYRFGQTDFCDCAVCVEKVNLTVIEGDLHRTGLSRPLY